MRIAQSASGPIFNSVTLHSTTVMDSGDDVQLTHPAAVHRTFASYDIDAAFDDDDDDDGDTSFHFSPDSIRKEMSRRIS